MTWTGQTVLNLHAICCLPTTYRHSKLGIDCLFNIKFGDWLAKHAQDTDKKKWTVQDHFLQTLQLDICSTPAVVGARFKILQFDMAQITVMTRCCAIAVLLYNPGCLLFIHAQIHQVSLDAMKHGKLSSWYVTSDKCSTLLQDPFYVDTFLAAVACDVSISSRCIWAACTLRGVSN